MGAYLAISTLYILNILLVIIDDLDLVRIACPKHETYPVLIVNSYTPLTAAIPFELFESVAGRHSQERYFGRRID